MCTLTDILVAWRKPSRGPYRDTHGTPDEVGTVGALLMGPDDAFITGSDILMDGGVTASWFCGPLAPADR